jgi:hypothetical protein
MEEDGTCCCGALIYERSLGNNLYNIKVGLPLHPSPLRKLVPSVESFADCPVVVCRVVVCCLLVQVYLGLDERICRKRLKIS